MTSNFDARNDSKMPFPGNEHIPPTEAEPDVPPAVALDSLKRDRFELLSAYLDGEITAVERRQVEDWLEQDPVVQRLYARLLKLRQGMRSLPVPAAEQPVEQTVEQVFSRLDRRPKRAIAWGGLAFAAMLVAAVFGNIPLSPSVHQMAYEPESNGAGNEALMIALDRPVIEIPKAPISSFSGTTSDSLFQSQHDIH